VDKNMRFWVWNCIGYVEKDPTSKLRIEMRLLTCSRRQVDGARTRKEALHQFKHAILNDHISATEITESMPWSSPPKTLSFIIISCRRDYFHDIDKRFHLV
jgi:hypothetical protein